MSLTFHTSVNMFVLYSAPAPNAQQLALIDTYACSHMPMYICNVLCALWEF